MWPYIKWDNTHQSCDIKPVGPRKVALCAECNGRGKTFVNVGRNVEYVECRACCGLGMIERKVQ